jgi:hypothetical protein
MKQKDNKVYGFDDTGHKEAPRWYVKQILSTIFPNAKLIEDVADQHISGVDWKIHWKTGNILTVDDKNDRRFCETGNIALDEATTRNKDTSQVFVHYPDNQGKWIFIHNYLYPDGYIEENSVHKEYKDQEWGEKTFAWILPISKLVYNKWTETLYAGYWKDYMIRPEIDWYIR